jgi:hypothetical protein
MMWHWQALVACEQDTAAPTSAAVSPSPIPPQSKVQKVPPINCPPPSSRYPAPARGPVPGFSSSSVPPSPGASPTAPAKSSSTTWASRRSLPLTATSATAAWTSKARPPASSSNPSLNRPPASSPLASPTCNLLAPEILPNCSKKPFQKTPLSAILLYMSPSAFRSPLRFSST